MGGTHFLRSRLWLPPAVATCLLLSACAQWPETPAPAVSGTAQVGGKLAKLAESQVGAPYRYGGATPAGFDCSGLVYYVYGEAGISVPRTAEAQFDRLPKIERRDLAPGDLVFFRGEGGGLLHVGIYVGSGWFVHAPDSGKPVSAARLDNPYWKNSYLGATRPPQQP